MCLFTLQTAGLLEMSEQIDGLLSGKRSSSVTVTKPPGPPRRLNQLPFGRSHTQTHKRKKNDLRP